MARLLLLRTLEKQPGWMPTHGGFDFTRTPDPPVVIFLTELFLAAAEKAKIPEEATKAPLTSLSPGIQCHTARLP